MFIFSCNLYGWINRFHSIAVYPLHPNKCQNVTWSPWAFPGHLPEAIESMAGVRIHPTRLY